MDRQRKLIILAIAALILVMILAAKVGFSQEERTGDLSCQQLGWDYGCKLDGAHSSRFLCDNGTNISANFTDCTRSLEPECKVLDWKSDKDFVELVSIKGGPGHEDYTYPPPGALGDSGLTAPDSKDISHVHWCWNEPPPPRKGSCCIECEEPGQETECRTTAESACAELGGSWLAGVTCEERKDCDKECTFEKTGSVCIEGGGCDELLLAECNEKYGDDYCAEKWNEGLTCDETVCATNTPLGAGCLLFEDETWDCIDGIQEDAYYATDGAIPEGWVEDATCDTLQCGDPVPTMPTKVLATLAILLTLTAGYFLRR